jgi:hypothetical protein
MQQYQFQGDPNAFGQPVIKIRIYHTDGTMTHFEPSGSQFNIGDTITNFCPVTNCRCKRALLVDPRFVAI